MALRCKYLNVSVFHRIMGRLYSTNCFTYQLPMMPSSCFKQLATDANVEANVDEKWSPQSRRTGAIAIKLGMSQLWDHKARRIPVTLLQVLDNEVVMVKREVKEGYNAIQIGALNYANINKVSHLLRGHFAKAGVVPKKVLQEFRVTEDALLNVGTKLSASHFVAGQHVDVSGITKGKGFQGVMKRHGMKGQPSSHGVSKTHRKMGATGGGGDPGRIWPGKKMPGRMGGTKVTALNLKVYRINHHYNVLFVKGCVPGAINSVIRVTDAKRLAHKDCPPFPTISEDIFKLPEETYWEYLQPIHSELHLNN